MSIDISSTFFPRFHSISRNGTIAHLISAIQQLYWNGSLNIAQYGDFWVDNKMWEKRLLSMLCCYAFCLPLFSKHIHRFGFNDCRKAKHLFLLLIFWSSNIFFLSEMQLLISHNSLCSFLTTLSRKSISLLFFIFAPKVS